MAKKFLIIAIWISLFVFLEIISYAIIANRKIGTLESVLGIIKEDPELFWRQRPHLRKEFQGVKVVTNSLGFRNREISVKKDKHSYRIICLGASPTFGWGVESAQTYPFLLEKELKEKTSSKKIEVINVGQIGYTTHQGIILLEKYLLRYSPDIVTVSYVLNDIDRYRFYRNEGLSDRELTRGNLLRIFLENTLNRSKSYLLLKRIILSLAYKNNRLATAIFKKQFGLSKVRVSEAEYRENLEKIIRICKVNNIKLVFIKMPINLSLPNLSEDKKDILKQGGNLGRFYYERACQYENAKDFEKAAPFFKKAKDYQVLDCEKDGIVYQRVMEEVAYKNDIPMVDAVRIFSEKGKDKNLFNGRLDPVHPNASGHRLIADAIAAEIIKKGL